MNNVETICCEILSVTKESTHEYTFRVKTDIKPSHGQFLQLSIPKFGEAPISVSEYGDGWLEFTIRAVGKVTDEIFTKRAGDSLFLRGAYGVGWPMDKLQDKDVVIMAGGTGVAPVRSFVNYLSDNPSYAKSVTLIIGFKNEEGIIFKDDLKKWRENKHFKTIYTLDNTKIDNWEVGYVSDHINKVDFGNFKENCEVIVVGPPPMMKCTAENTEAKLVAKMPEEKIWVSFERKMSCAIGKCGHCRIDEVYVCLEGPVFNYSQAKKLID